MVRSSSYGDQVLTGGTARKREWEHERTIRWNSGADGKVRMGEGVIRMITLAAAVSTADAR
jgi:hypothetical protein